MIQLSDQNMGVKLSINVALVKLSFSLAVHNVCSYGISIPVQSISDKIIEPAVQQVLNCWTSEPTASPVQSPVRSGPNNYAVV